MKPRLLIIDDRPIYGRSLQRALRTEYECDLACSSEDTRRMAPGAYAGALVDICLDEAAPHNRDGLELISWLRRERPDLSIIAMSALDDPALEQGSLSAGANRFLRKPIIVTELRRCLGELLRRS